MQSDMDRLNRELAMTKQQLSREKEVVELYRENSRLRKQLVDANERISYLESQLRERDTAIRTPRGRPRDSTLETWVSSTENNNIHNQSAVLGTNRVSASGNRSSVVTGRKRTAEEMLSAVAGRKSRALAEAKQKRPVEQFSQRSLRLLECSKHRAEYATRRKVVNELVKQRPELLDDGAEFRRVLLADERIQALPDALRPASFVDSVLRRLRRKLKRGEHKRAAMQHSEDSVSRESARELFGIAERSEGEEADRDSQVRVDDDRHEDDTVVDSDCDLVASTARRNVQTGCLPSQNSIAANEVAEAEAETEAEAEDDLKPVVDTETQIRQFMQESDDDDLEVLF